MNPSSAEVMTVLRSSAKLRIQTLTRSSNNHTVNVILTLTDGINEVKVEIGKQALIELNDSLSQISALMTKEALCQ